MPGATGFSDAAMRDWLAAQQNLIATQTPGWPDIERVIDTTRALGPLVQPLLPDAQWTHPYPLNAAQQAPDRSHPDWPRFARADAALRTRMAGAWLAAAGGIARPLGHDADTAKTLRNWAAALDRAFENLVASPDYAELQTEWLRAALACDLPIAPPAAPANPALPAIAQTPKHLIWREGKTTLHRYTGSAPPTTGPLLIVHGLIGRASVTDLEPRRSLVSDLLTAGTDLWLIDWGNPAPEDHRQDFTYFCETLLGEAVATIHSKTGRRAALLGICQGGVFSLCHAARHADALSGIALTGTPVDFHADAAEGEGYLNRLARSLPRDVIEGLLGHEDMLPGALTGALFQGMTPGRTVAKYTADLSTRLADPARLQTFLRMEAWLADRPDHPGGAAREWLYDLYQQNALVKGKFRIAGDPVDLGAIRCPVLNIIGQYDHIVPPACSRALAAHVPEHIYQSIETETGHIGVLVSDAGREQVARRLTAWLTALKPGH
ncbi:MAG: alpha/beta fold hydrolase [Pseudomonadota bacterium]